MLTLPKIETTKTLYSVAGVADLAYETVKSYATDVQKKVDGYRYEATTKLTDARSKVTEKATAAKTSVSGFDPKTLPALAKEQYAVLPEKVKTAAKARLDATSTSANGTYNDLAARGETLVAKFKKPEAAETPEASAPAEASAKPETPKAPAEEKKA